MAAALLALAAFAHAPHRLAAASRRGRADQAYRHALAARAKLEAKRPRSRSLRSYVKLVKAFDLVYRIDPGYPNTPQALSAEAALFEEMGRVFGSDRYYQNAVETFHFLAEQYPGATVSRDGLFRIAEIYRVDLENPGQAAQAYDKFLRLHPAAPEAAEARLRLNELNRRTEPAQTGPSAGAPATFLARETPSDVETAPAAGRLLPVNDVRYWEGPNYTRVVISLGDQTTYQSVRLEHPDRLVFDLANTRLSRALAGKTFPVENGFLREIRVAQFQPTVARVVLDLTKIQDYTVFTLPNPFRLIIDIHGAAQPLLAGTPERPREASALRETARLRPAPAAMSVVPVPSSGETETAPSETVTVPAPVSSTPPAGGAIADTRQLATPGGDSYDRRTGNPAEPATEIETPAPMASGSPTLTRALGLKIARIVIDPGHGGHDTGTIGPDGLEEKNVALDVALRLRQLIRERMGAQVVMTRSDDTFIPLEERTAIANQNAADLFISIHCNASRDPSARGIEVYYLNFTTDPNSLEVAARENATSRESVYQLQSLIKKIALTEKIDESNQLAQQVDTSLERATARSGNHQPNRGLKKAPFVVLIGANMPSILAEISFLTNPHDEHLLSEASYRQQIAEGLYRGVARYVANLGTMKIAERGSARPTARRVSRAPADPGGPVAGDDPPKR